MVPPSIFILLSALAAFHLSLTETIEPGGVMQDIPNELEAEQLLLQNQKIHDLANQLVLEYLYDANSERLPNQVKRVPGGSTLDKKDSVSSMHRVFAREGIPPNLMKLSYGKRGNPNPYLNDLSKRAYSNFMFGKRDRDTQMHSMDKRNGYSSFMFGKREELDGDKRGYSDLLFGKRLPEVLAKRAYSDFFFGKRGGKFTKFMFGKREDDETAADDLTMDEN